VNLFIASEAATTVDSGKVTLQQTSKYPWDGDVTIAVQPEAPREFTLHVRLPGWAANPTLRVNGAAVSPQIVRGYAAIRRTWKSGDTVQLSLPMDVQRLAAHPNVLQAQGKIAIRRGPLIYAFEQADNAVPLHDVALPAGATFQSRVDPSLAGGVVRLTTEGLLQPAATWDQRLYQPVAVAAPKKVPLSAVPYAIWGNRGAGEMVVWIDSR